jgi:hypothetical protein
MATLLSLPRELSDRIIETTLLDEREPPKDTASAQANRMQDRHLPQDGVSGMKSWSYGPSRVRYELSTSDNATSLLLTSREINKMTKDAIARLYPNGATYKLDVMVVDEMELWPSNKCPG